MKTNPNDKYPNISKFMPELKIFKMSLYSNVTISGQTSTADTKYEEQDYILASDLEAVLAKGVVVYGRKDDADHVITQERIAKDTHVGLLISYQPIESQEPVSIKELLDAMYGVRKGQGYDYLEKIAKRIEKNGIKN